MSLTVAVNDLMTGRLVFGTADNETAYNVLHYQVSTIIGAPLSVETALTALAQSLYNAFEAKWANVAAADVTFREAVLTSVFPLPRSLSMHYAPGTPTVGTFTGESLPMQDAWTILKQTRIGNKTGLGRMFVCGIPESQAAGGLISATLVTAAAPLIAELASPVTATGTGWTIVLNPVLVNGPEDNPTRISQIVSSRLSNSVIKTQRRRRPGKGV